MDTLIMLIVAVVFWLVAAAAFGPFVATVLAGLFLWASFYKLEPNTYGEPRIWGWRAPAWLCIKRGWGFWLPSPIGHLFWFTRLPQAISSEVPFVAQDKEGEASLDINEPFRLEYRINPNIKDENGRIRFLSLEFQRVVSGITIFMQSKIGKLGGTITVDDFRKLLKVIEDYLRSSIQLQKPLHVDHSPSTCGLDDCRHPEGTIKDTALLDFYSDHFPVVGKAVSDFVKNSEAHSSLEEYYGLDFLRLELLAPVFTKEDREAFGRKRREEEKARGAGVQLATAKSFKEQLGVSGEEALDAAQVAQLGIPKTIHAIRGNSNALPLLPLGASGTTTPTASSTPQQPRPRRRK